METALPFIPGMVYNRRKDIHGIYGGNWQSGICPTSHFPFILIFSGQSGKQHGYQDGWDNENIFAYTGEGQEGDMKFTRGNLALRNHLDENKRVFLFENLGKGLVRFESELEFHDVDYFETPDTKGNNRIGIKFIFKRAGVSIPIESKSKPASVTSEPSLVYAGQAPTQTERQGLVTTRVGHGLYRKRIIHRWEYQCAVTGFDKLNLLIASHIVPWSESGNEERLDIHNGILLSPVYDALFDRHLASFEDSGNIILSDRIEMSAYRKIGIVGTERIRKEFSSENRDYLARHRAALIT